MRIFLLLAILFVSAPLLANPIVIDDSREARAPAPATNDEVDVRMESEDVRLSLRPELGLIRRNGFEREPSAARLDVKGTYKFKNPGAEVALLIGFPCRGNVEAESVVVTMDGAAIKAEPYEPEKDEDDYWFGDWVKWKATFPKGECEMKVEYSFVLYDKREVGYILHTGASWKDSIRDIAVSLTLAEGFTVGHLRRVEPADGMTQSADGVFAWEYQDMEPGLADDILVEFSLESWDDKIKRMGQGATQSWRARLELLGTLSEPPLVDSSDFGNLTKTQRDGFLAALEAAVPRFDEKEGKLTVYDDTPAREPLPEGGSAYDFGDSLDDVFVDIISMAILAVEELKSEPRARGVLQKLVKVFRASEAGTLHFESDGVRTAVTLSASDYILEDAESVLSESE